LAGRDLSALTAAQTAAEIASGALSSEEVTRACLDRIEAAEDTVKAFAHLDPEFAVAQKRPADRSAARRSGRGQGHHRNRRLAHRVRFASACRPAAAQ